MEARKTGFALFRIACRSSGSEAPVHIGNKRHKRIKREVEQYSLERNKEVQKQEREEEEETFFSLSLGGS